MTLRIATSAAARRTSPPSISRLMQAALANPQVISLAAGFVDQATLPVAASSEAVASILAEPIEGRRALQYGTTIGDPAFRRRLIENLEVEDGVEPGHYRGVIDRTVVTTGSAQLIYLIGEALLDPGDIVLVESPTYFVFLGPIETRAARAIRVPIDEEGLRLDALEDTFQTLERKGELERVKLVYSIPEHANPTGISLAESRRGPLVELVKRWSNRSQRRIFLLEDAAYRGLSFDGPEPPSLWSLDPEGETVILARTFSKTFSPGLKIGYGILPESLLEPILFLKGNHDFGSAHFNQQLLDHVLGNGTYRRHVSTLSSMYGSKRDVFLTALQQHLGSLRPAVRWTEPKGGLFVWMTVPESLDTGFEGPLFARALEEGVLYVPGEFAFAPEPSPVPRNHLRLSFGVPGEPDLAEGARRLAQAIRACLGTTGGS